MLHKIYAKKMIHKRNKLKISQQELADIVGITRQSISQIEKGTFIPSLKTYNKLDKILNLTNPIIFFLKIKKYKQYINYILLFFSLFILTTLIIILLFIFV